MSKFAAIEARQTEYPASVNDVVWLVRRVRELREALTAFDGSDLAASDPTRYVDIVRARTALAALDAPNVP